MFGVRAAITHRTLMKEGVMPHADLGINNNRPVIVVPRIAKYREHVDDHQVQIAEAFEQKGMVIYCKTISDLPDCIEKAKTYQFSPYDIRGGKIEDIVLGFMDIFK